MQTLGTAPHPILGDGRLGRGCPAPPRDARAQRPRPAWWRGATCPCCGRLLDAHGFTLHYVWQENRWLEGEPERWPTAFVDGGRPGARAVMCTSSTSDRTAPSSSCTPSRGRSPTAITGQGQHRRRGGPLRLEGDATRSCTPGTPCQMGSYATSKLLQGD